MTQDRSESEPRSQTAVVLEKIGIAQRSFTDYPTLNEFASAISPLSGGRVSRYPEAIHPSTFACMRIRAEAVSSIPMVIHTGSRKDPKKLESGPMVTLIESPNPWLDYATFMYLVQTVQDASGSVLLIANPNRHSQNRPFGKGEMPTEIWPADPKEFTSRFESVNGRPDPTRFVWRSNSNGFEYSHDQVGVARQPSRRMIEISADAEQKSQGLGLINVASQTIQADVAAAEFQKAFIKNDMTPSAWALLEKKLSSEGFKRFKDQMNSDYSGPTNAGRFMLLENIKNFIVNPHTARDSQFLEGREKLLEENCMVFGVPKSLLGYTADVNRSTNWGQRAAFYDNTVRPLLARIESVFWNTWFRHFKGGKAWPMFDISSVPELQKTLAEKIENFDKLTKAGVPHNIAARMAELDLEAYAGDDVALVPAGMIPRGDAAAPMIVDDSPEAEPESGELDLAESQAIAAIIEKVQSAALPANSAKQILLLSFGLEPVQVDALIDPADPEIKALAAAAAPDIEQIKDENSADPYPVIAILEKVQSGAIDADSAKELMALSFNFSPEEIAKLIDPVEAALIDPAETAEQPVEPSPAIKTENGDSPIPDKDEEAPGSDEDSSGRFIRPAMVRLRRAIHRRGARIVRVRKRMAEKTREMGVDGHRALKKTDWTRFQKGVVGPRETKFTKAMRGLFDKQRKAILKQFDEMLRDRKIPSNVSFRADDDPMLGPDDASFFDLPPTDWMEQLEPKLTPIYEDMAERAARRAWDETEAGEFVTNRFAHGWSEFIDERLGNEMVNVNATTLDNVRDTFRNGLRDGKTATEIRAELSSMSGFSRARARNVAITEMGGMTNNARIEVFDANGIDEFLWNTVNDGKSRTAHTQNEFAGSRLRGEPFPSGARWPHDPNAQASDVIGCRCGVLAAID